MTHLHLFALNAESDIRHTNLTRAKGEAADLPDLAAWLRVRDIDADAIELFPVKDLEDMALSDYTAMAFATDALSASDRARIDALEGSVLLVPDSALEGTPNPGPELTLIATLPLSAPDHSADLPKAEVTVTERPAPPAPPPAPRKGPPVVLITLILTAVLSAIVLVFG